MVSNESTGKYFARSVMDILKPLWVWDISKQVNNNVRRTEKLLKSYDEIEKKSRTHIKHSNKIMGESVNE